MMKPNTLSLLAAAVCVSLTGCELFLTEPGKRRDANVEDEWIYESTSRHTFPNSTATTYCGASAIASIRQVGRTFEGRLNGMNTCEARGLRFADAINHGIEAGEVNRKGVRFVVRGCLHDGGLRRDDNNVIMGNFHPDTCNGWSGEFRMRRRR